MVRQTGAISLTERITIMMAPSPLPTERQAERPTHQISGKHAHHHVCIERKPSKMCLIWSVIILIVRCDMGFCRAKHKSMQCLLKMIRAWHGVEKKSRTAMMKQKWTDRKVLVTDLVHLIRAVEDILSPLTSRSCLALEVGSVRAHLPVHRKGSIGEDQAQPPDNHHQV